MDRSFVITDSLSCKGATPNIPSLLLCQHKQWTAQEVKETEMYCRAAHSCAESYWEGKNTESYQFTFQSTIHCHS